MNKMKILTTYRSYPKGYNITSRKDAETQSYVSNDLNQYTEIQDSEGTITPSYDADGNLLSDARFTYTWNGENRLIAVENSTLRLEFTYDYKGRRIEKKVYNWSGTDWTLEKDIKFVYDGWNVIAEIENDNLTKTYIWGEDLSGTLQGAGGVGGLLAVKIATDTYYPCYDANGNITAYTDISGNMVYTCEYTPFGKVLSFTGTSPCNFGFSTKYTDTETALIYYGYRYYSPELGRWISRDPIEEKGGVNLYCFVSNTPNNFIEYLGKEIKQANTPRNFPKNATSQEIQKIKNNINLNVIWHISHYTRLGAGLYWKREYASGVLRKGNNTIHLKYIYKSCPLIINIHATPRSGYESILRPDAIQYLHKRIREPYYYPHIISWIDRRKHFVKGKVLKGELWVRYWQIHPGGGILAGKDQSVVYDENAQLYIEPDYKLKKPKHIKIEVRVIGNVPETNHTVNFILENMEVDIKYEK